jgi:hypothetical protein
MIEQVFTSSPESWKTITFCEIYENALGNLHCGWICIPRRVFCS